MSALYLFSVFCHLLAAFLWVGGMAFFAIIVVPVARKELEPPSRAALLRAAGARLARASGWIFGVLVLTGVGNIWLRGLGPSLFVVAFWKSPMGIVLGAKLVLVALVIAASTFHSHEARRVDPSPARAALAAKMGRLTLLLSLAVVALAVMLVRGTP